MRPSSVFILLLAISLSKAVFGCGFYPYGEDIRFSMLLPQQGQFPTFANFHYSSNLFSPLEYDANSNGPDDAQRMNIALWRKRCANIPKVEEVFDALYLNDHEIIDAQSSNGFIHYLHAHNDKEAIAYLRFALECSFLNTHMDDPWERSEHVSLPQRSKMIAHAKEIMKELKDEDLRLRYAFLAIRLAYYNQQSEEIEALYRQHFSPRSKKNILDHWALYFKVLTMPQGAERNFLASQVFLNAPDKRFMVHNKYDRSFPVSEALRFAKSDEERSAVWLLEGIRSPGKALESIIELQKLAPRSEGLAFLLQREVNKLEDWIYTPYYTNFDPSVGQEGGSDDSSIMQARIGNDRAYAKELLNLISNADLRKVAEPDSWKVAEAYLLLMTENQGGALQAVADYKQSKNADQGRMKQLEMIGALALVSQQAQGHAPIPKQVEAIITREFEAGNFKFVFAVARELEYLGNTSDAALLLSHIDNYGKWSDGVYWRTAKRHETLWDDTYYDYFFYMDAQYTPVQVQDLIVQVEHAAATDAFSRWKYSIISKQIPRLYDLLGTKHLRANDLKLALSNFEKVNDSLWVSSHYPYEQYLDANPFYTNAYNEHLKTEADTITYNKESIVRTLMAYLAKAEDPACTDRDYYYFLAANCYLNMTQYGNSWLMKRYYWTSYVKDTKLADDPEYYGCKLAKAYYLKAKQTSKSPEFSALCLRMAGRCESYELRYKTYDDRWEEGRDERMFEANAQYSALKKNYPEHYEELVSNCLSFDTYFNARRLRVGS